MVTDKISLSSLLLFLFLLLIQLERLLQTQNECNHTSTYYGVAIVFIDYGVSMYPEMSEGRNAKWTDLLTPPKSILLSLKNMLFIAEME